MKKITRSIKISVNAQCKTLRAINTINSDSKHSCVSLCVAIAPIGGSGDLCSL